MVPGGVHNYAYCLDASSDFTKFYACTCGRGLFKGSLDEENPITGDTIIEEKENSLVHNAEEAKQILLSGEYNHKH